MKHYLPAACILVCGIFLAIACSRKHNDLDNVPELNLTVTHSMKGWEVYSWPEGSKWKFSFMAGTNATKTLSEVTVLNGPGVLMRVTGVDSAKMVLNKFPKGEDVLLIGQGWLQAAWQGQYGNLQLPPADMINQLKSFCTQKQLTLTVVN